METARRSFLKVGALGFGQAHAGMMRQFPHSLTGKPAPRMVATGRPA